VLRQRDGWGPEEHAISPGLDADAERFPRYRIRDGVGEERGGNLHDDRPTALTQLETHAAAVGIPLLREAAFEAVRDLSDQLLDELAVCSGDLSRGHGAAA